MCTAWRVSHAERTERRAERKEAGEDDSEEDEPVEIPLSAVTMHPKGTTAPASSVRAQVFEERVDLSNNMTGWQMIAVGVRRLVLARGELDRLEGPGYAARRAELRRKAQEAARARDRQEAAAPQNEAEESDATEEEATRETTTRRGRPRGGTKVEARKRILLCTVLPMCSRGVPSSHPSLGLSVFFLFSFRVRSSENKGPAGGGGVAERGRGER